MPLHPSAEFRAPYLAIAVIFVVRLDNARARDP